MRIKELLILVFLSILLVVPFKKRIKSDLRETRLEIKERPAHFVSRVLVSFIVGQGVFWRVGYDQIGLFMDPKFEIGLGIRIANWIYEKLPPSPWMPWAVKSIEILADFGKVPIEGTVYRRHRVVPDGVAALVGQPLWSIIETVEKVAGAVLHPERVVQPESIKVALGCIYGSLFRYACAAMIWFAGEKINRVLVDPIERALFRVARVFT
jgi:hypothetical protein